MRSAAARALMQSVVQAQDVASHGDTDEVGGYVLLRAFLLPLLQAANLAASNTKKLATLVREHVLAPFALHTEPRAPSRNSFHAGVSRKAEKRPVVSLQLDHAAAARHNLQQAVAGRAFRVRFERRSAIDGEPQELPVPRLPAKIHECQYSWVDRNRL